MTEQSIIIETIDGVCLVDLKYSTPNTLDNLINCKPGSIVKVADLDKYLEFIIPPDALKKLPLDNNNDK